MYKYTIITQNCVYLMITLDKKSICGEKSDMIYDQPSEEAPDHFFGSYVFNQPGLKAGLIHGIHLSVCLCPCL